MGMLNEQYCEDFQNMCNAIWAELAMYMFNIVQFHALGRCWWLGMKYIQYIILDIWCYMYICQTSRVSTYLVYNQILYCYMLYNNNIPRFTRMLSTHTISINNKAFALVDLWLMLMHVDGRKKWGLTHRTCFVHVVWGFPKHAFPISL